MNRRAMGTGCSVPIVTRSAAQRLAGARPSTYFQGPLSDQSYSMNSIWGAEEASSS
jgi:hypothetical protein